MELQLALLLLGLLPLGLLYLMLRRPRLPPGLARLPFLGSLPWILWSGKHVVELVKNDREKHGPLSTVGLGPHNIVFINEPQLIKEVMGMDAAAGRQPNKMFLNMKSWGRAMGLVSPSGNCPVWKEQTRFVLRSLKDQGFGRKSAESVKEEAIALVDHILTTTEGEELLIEDLFNIPVVNVIWKMVASKTFVLGSDEGTQFVRLIYEWFSRSVSPLAQVPLVGRLLCAGQIKRRFQMFSEMQKLFEQAIEEHDEDLDESDPRDLIDKYLIEVRSGRPGFTKQQLTIIIMDLFAAGSETSSTTLRWAVLYLVMHPEAQRRCQAELDQLGPARTPSLEDMDRLVYCQATVLEVLRLGCTAPGTLPHMTLADLTIAGFTFPAGQILVGNFMSTHSDPQLWDKPEQFLPDRFLNDSETGLRETPHFFPFSVGRRVTMYFIPVNVPHLA